MSANFHKNFEYQQILRYLTFSGLGTVYGLVEYFTADFVFYLCFHGQFSRTAYMPW